MSRTFTANIENKNLWAGLGTQYTSISQIINEFVDNSISNFKGHPSLNSNSIIITLHELDSGDVKVSIEDSGTGISDFPNAFGIGSKTCQDSPLNEHGFGMKQAFAAANPKNDSWRLCTRTDINRPTFDEVSAPYTFNEAMTIEDTETDWPGDLNSTGTYVEFTCSRELFKTVSRGLKGDYSRFIKLSALLYEDLGFTYSGIISSLSVSMKLKVIEKGKAPAVYNMSALAPDEDTQCGPGRGYEKVSFDDMSKTYKIDDTSNLTINYGFYTIKGKESPRDDSEFFNNSKSSKYYKANMSTSGVEIRYNGRVMKYNVFSEVWNKEKHNSYNSLLVIVDLRTDDASLLPGTTTSKNGLNEGDAKLEALYQWIREKMPNPDKRISDSTDERELFRRLRDNKLRNASHTTAKPTVSVEQRVWHIISSDEKRLPRIDLYERTTSGDINVYEGKCHKTDSQDVYQLKMYWDGLISDGITPTCGILVADEHPVWVVNLLNQINTLTDANGNHYNFVTDTWKGLAVKD